MSATKIDTSSSSGDSSISTAAIQSIIDKLKTQRNRSSTRACYYGVWRKFNEFFVKLDIKPESWEERLTLFVGYLIENNKKANTIRSYISAIKAVLKTDGHDLNEDVYLLKSLTRACRWRNKKITNRLPIRKNLLKLMLLNLSELFHKQPYLECLYKTLFTTAYFGLFRVGELTQSEHVMKASDVHIGINKNKLKFVLHSSKTHWWDDKLQVIKINASEYSATGNKLEVSKEKRTFCPFEIINDFMKIRKYRASEQEQFFIFNDRSPVKPVHFRTVLKDVLKNLNLDSRLYSVHGFCGGRSSDLLSMGISVETIRKISRWSSNAVYRYLTT